MNVSVYAYLMEDEVQDTFNENKVIQYQDFSEINNLNEELYQISSEKVSIVSKAISIFGFGKAVEKRNRLISKSLERREVMVDLADKRPDLFLTFKLSKEDKNIAFKDAEPYLEKEAVREGTLEIVESPHAHSEGNMNHAEDEQNFEYYLRTNNRRYNLRFVDGSFPDGSSGDKVKINGVELENYIVTSSGQTRAVVFTAGEDNYKMGGVGDSFLNKREENFGNQKIAIILTKSPRERYDIPFLQSHMQKTNNYYNETSYGQVNLTWDVYGPFEIDGNYVSVNHPLIDENVNFSKYSRIISVDSRNCFGCAIVGKSEYETDDGAVNLSVTWVKPIVFEYPEYYSVVIHELGHNFGVFHSNFIDCGDNYIDNFDNCKSLEYGDYFDVMGYNIYNFATGHINSIHKEAITWIGENDINEIKSNGNYTINPFEIQPNLSLSNRNIVIKVPRTIDEYGNGKDFYYLEYRKPIGYDSFVNLTNSSGVQLRISKFIKNGPGYSPSQHISIHKEIYPHYSQIDVGESFFDPKTNVNITTLESTFEGAKINIKLSDKKCIRREPIIKIAPSVINGTFTETFYYNFEITNNDSDICNDREIYFNISGDAYFHPNRYASYISRSHNYPSLISSGEKISGVISLRIRPGPVPVGEETYIKLMDVDRGLYASSNVSYNMVNPNFEKVDFNGEDKARRFFYNDIGGYYLVDNLGKVYRRGITFFTADNGPEFSNGNYLSEIDYNKDENIILLDLKNNLYDLGRPFSSIIATPNEPLPRNIISFDVDFEEDYRLVFLGREGNIYFSYIGGFNGYYENVDLSCRTWDGKTNLLQLGTNHTVMIKATENNLYILTKKGEVFVCGKKGNPDVSLARFNQTLPDDLGIGDKEAVSFVVNEGKDGLKGIAMVDSYGNVYTSGQIQYQGSPAFGQNIARDIQFLPEGPGYGILRGTGEIYECFMGVCKIKDIQNDCKIDFDCNDNNNYTEDKCIFNNPNNYCTHQKIECIADSDCIKDELIGVCINPGKVNSYCNYLEPPINQTCLDMDGYNSVNASFVNYTGNIYNDVCESGNQVREYYCKLNVYTQQNEVDSSVIECKNSCSNGACLQTEPIYRVCSDNDPDNALGVLGTVIFKEESYIDNCKEQGQSVQQYFCVDGKMRNFVKRCVAGTSCSSGVCR